MFKLMVLGVAVILISLTFIAVGCGSASPSVQVTSFGGPYAYLGGIQKIAEFQWYQDHIKDLSKRAVLDIDLLKTSIDKNRTANGTGLQLQRYNYVIPERDRTIYVGVWNKGLTWSAAAEWIKDGLSEATTCIVDDTAGGTPAATPIPATENKMINFHSEDPVIGSSSSPCWLKASQDKKKVGILDAMTKHFMLLQENPNLESFNLERFKDWTSKEVAYAGELFVLISGETCLVVINNGSGTYKTRCRQRR